MSKLTPGRYSAASSTSTKLGKSSKVQGCTVNDTSSHILVFNGQQIALLANGAPVREGLLKTDPGQRELDRASLAGFSVRPGVTLRFLPRFHLESPTEPPVCSISTHGPLPEGGAVTRDQKSVRVENPYGPYELVFEMRLGGDTTAASDAHLTPRSETVRARTRDRQSVPSETLTQQLIDKADVRRLDEHREAMRAAAVQAILQNSEWVTASQLSDIINPALRNKHAKAGSFLKDKRVFALLKDGENIYPRYQFDATGQPIPVVAEILKVFDGYTSFRVAAWFESTSSALNGKRPREVLETMSREVLAAAVAHERGPMHG